MRGAAVLQLWWISLFLNRLYSYEHQERRMEIRVLDGIMLVARLLFIVLFPCVVIHNT